MFATNYSNSEKDLEFSRRRLPLPLPVVWPSLDLATVKSENHKVEQVHDQVNLFLKVLSEVFTKRYYGTRAIMVMKRRWKSVTRSFGA